MVSSSIWHNMDGPPIIVTENVVEYRKAIAEYVTHDDVALEVGCAEGLTTALIAQTAKQTFGIDKSQSQTAKAISRHQHISNLTFRQIDAWDMTAVRRLSEEHGVANFNVIFIDVSGSRKVGDVESLLGKYEHVFNPRLFIVKAYQLKRLVTRCKLFTLPPAGTAGATTDSGPPAAPANLAAPAVEYSGDFDAVPEEPRGAERSVSSDSKLHVVTGDSS